jgi:gamma-glutamylaminecyclotransferase
VLLFVYGTLRRGEPNHPKLGGARFVGMARTQPRYDLVDFGGFPALLEHGRTSVIGELYEVPAEHVSELDAFEDVPTLYERKAVALDAVANDSRERVMLGRDDALAYVMRRETASRAPHIAGGDWRRDSSAIVNDEDSSFVAAET